MTKEKINWFEIWCDDKESIINTMYRNMQSDIECGYDPNGKCIKDQREAINAYEDDYHKKLMDIANMDSDQKVNRWCYCDLKVRGAIA